jgi:hypothetical protein
MRPKEPEPSLPAPSDAVWGCPSPISFILFHSTGNQSQNKKVATDDPAKRRTLQDYQRLAHRKQTNETHHSRPSDQHSAAIASAFADGRFSACPLPGRTYMVKAGATF